MRQVYIPPVIALPVIGIIAISATILVVHTINVISTATPDALAETTN